MLVEAMIKMELTMAIKSPIIYMGAEKVRGARVKITT
jgi:hypothetical protein